MKVRAGFVSNSSSSSFIVFTGFTDQDLSDVMSNVQNSIINGIERSKAKLVILQKLASDGNDVNAIKQMLNTIPTDIDVDSGNDTISLDLDTVKNLYDQMIKISNDEDLDKYVVNQFMKQDTCIHDTDEGVCIYKTKIYYSDEIDKVCKYVIGYMNDHKIAYPVYLFCESFDIDYYDDGTVEEYSLIYNYCQQKKLMSIYDTIGE